MSSPQRRRFRVRGIVQGVGFRPFVYNLAVRLGLAGFVLNDVGGVLIEVEGDVESLDAFEDTLRRHPPPVAVVEAIERDALPPTGEGGFDIRESLAGGRRIASVAPDVATCDDCRAEIGDPAQRRHRYPFTNCTNCGPRFTITTAIPYDRPNTTMAGFEMCAACKSEYEDPGDRRFHAQPIACPDCGPRVRLVVPGRADDASDPIGAAADLLGAGKIVAVKGLGGYHLACDATNEDAVRELRRRKAREEKPFAVMAADLEAARALAEVGDEEAAVMASRRRPIVLVRGRGAVAAGVAPGNRYLGVMLPYTPLHHLLLAAVGVPLVLTSGNLTDEPIAYMDRDAFERLGRIADAFLVHDRDIHMRCDDSVVRVLDGAEYPLRRSRGYAPEPLLVVPPFDRPVLAAGPELKHTFCVGVDDRAILSHHIGDLENYEAMTAFTDGVQHFLRIFEVAPEVVAYDLHPDYLSTRWALELEGPEKVGVQHHHAHIASCLADNGRSGRVIGVALDGTGYGSDGTIWGFEVLECDLTGFRRAAHLRYVPLPGGAAAITEPWRMAAVYLHAAFGDAAAAVDVPFVARTSARWAPILHMARTGLNSPHVSSAGRLFDAAAALCGVRDRVSYEGQAAAELEQIADPATTRAYPCTVAAGIVDGVELIAAMAEDLARGTTVPEVAAAFHNGVASAVVAACEDVRAATGLATVALSGGTFQNLLLLRRVTAALAERGFEVLRHRRVPANDGGLALGQAVVAGARARAGGRSSG